MYEYFSFRIEKRKLRNQGHFFFDLIHENGFMSKAQCYEWLSEKLDIPLRNCHFSLMKSYQIKQSIVYSIEYLNYRYTETDLPKYILIE